ncbi:hypothetical protein V2A60_000088 [Cordyceps javanica]|uniref:Heat shock protein 30 n=1 Tax=Cordyceps javanica TaxID=43265 RepID=A0A545V6E2_9HYPO|nr:heat shock protein 30 [Cordyceps javanica]TQW08531.1 heat shock protein 30 [Cordyceps javanica]
MSLFPRALYDSGDSSSFTPLFRLLDEFDSYSRQGGGGNGGASSSFFSSPSGGSSSTFWQPKFDVRESGDRYELHGEFPGMSKDDIYLEFPAPQTLVVRGKSERTYAGAIEDVSSSGGKPAAITEAGEAEGAARGADTAAPAPEAAENKTEQQQPKYWLRERRVGEFSRTFNFPSPVDQDAISAGFKDGILSVAVPKAKKPQPRRIAIN